MLEQQVSIFKKQYRTQILTGIFDFSTASGAMDSFMKFFEPLSEDFSSETGPYLIDLHDKITEMYDVAKRFQLQLMSLCAADNEERLRQRIEAAEGYFSIHLEDVLYQIEQMPAVTDSRTEAIDFTDRLSNIYGLLAEKMHLVKGITSEPSVDQYFALRASFQLQPLHLHVYSGDRKTKQKIEVKDVELYKQLLECRNDICEEFNTAVNAVANAKMLVEIANRKPKTLDELRKIKGFGKVKTERFGEQFIAVVKQYLESISDQ